MIFLLVGFVWGGIALKLPTTLQTPEQYIDAGELKISIPATEVHNFELADRRQTQLIIASLIIVVGAIFLGFGFVISQKTSKTESTPLITTPFVSASSLLDAAENGDFDMAYGLLRDGADINQKNAEGKTAVDLAREHGNTRIVDLLLSNGASLQGERSLDVKKMNYKYQGLETHLSSRPSTTNEITLGFGEIETIIGGSLPSSAFNYREWWANQSDTSNRPQAKAWVSAGFVVDEVHQEQLNSWVRFKRL